MKLNRDYPHLLFDTKQWQPTDTMLYLLGQCEAYVKAISNTPILPQFYKDLMKIALQKGAQATTAIEGNSLSDDEISKLVNGQKLPPSKEYQEIEVVNIINAFNELLEETVYMKEEQLITPALLLRFHRLVGKNLGEHFNAIPGKFRTNDVVVGSYRCPDARDVETLVHTYCDWMKKVFKFESGRQPFSDVIIQAIVAHVYLEWIHPFGDGNGRTGRLLEFYILSRGGSPDITLHILSNHYNNTRNEYYRHLANASKTTSLQGFLEYALLGFRDGLVQTLETIQSSQLLNAWQKYVYDKFNEVEITNKPVFKRRRTLALEVPIDRKFTFKEVPELTIRLARFYSNISPKTLERDIKELLDLDIFLQDGSDYFANLSVINKMVAKSKGLTASKKR